MRSDRSFDELVENYDRREAIRSGSWLLGVPPASRDAALDLAWEPGVTRF
jgi:hypothetical protein